MSIDFTLQIQVVRNFYNGNVCEHRSSILDSTLDLGNFRALRSICDAGDDYCGTFVRSSREVDVWLYGAEVQTGAFQIQAAARYISAIRATFAGQIDLDPSPDENYNPEIEIICTITYA